MVDVIPDMNAVLIRTKVHSVPRLRTTLNNTMARVSTTRATTTTSRSPSAPRRQSDGTFVFDDFPEFQPNRSPEEILRAGSFGGTYFRPIKSAVCPGVKFGDEVWQELPREWIDGLDPQLQLCSSTYRPSVNKYKVKSGASLEEWEQSGWIRPQDPYGWFQWYCRFFQGRRTEDDGRQVARWVACAGETSGRWRNRLCKVVFQQGKRFGDPSASPVIRQTLLHWGYELTEPHYRKWGSRQGAESASDTEENPQAGSTAGSRKRRVAKKARASEEIEAPEQEGKPHSDSEVEEPPTRPMEPSSRQRKKKSKDA